MVGRVLAYSGCWKRVFCRCFCGHVFGETGWLTVGPPVWWCGGVFFPTPSGVVLVRAPRLRLRRRIQSDNDLRSFLASPTFNVRNLGRVLASLYRSSAYCFPPCILEPAPVHVFPSLTFPWKMPSPCVPLPSSFPLSLSPTLGRAHRPCGRTSSASKRRPRPSPGLQSPPRPLPRRRSPAWARCWQR